MQVLLLQLLLKFDAEHCDRQVASVFRAIRRPTYRAMHSTRNIAFVVKTDESSKELVNRLASELEATCFETWYCQSAARDIISKNGSIDPLVSRVMASYAEIENRRYPKNVRQLQIRRPGWQVKLLENRVGHAPVQMTGERPPRHRKPSRNPNRP